MNYPRFNLFCLPFSGAGAYSYQVFEKHAPPSLSIQTLELPGRGSRVLEPLLESVEVMVEDIFKQIKTELNTPYAIYGHSLGTLIAYQLTHRIRAENRPLPLHLFVTGRSAPSIAYEDSKKHLLPRPQFLEKLKELGGSPQEVLEDDGLMDFFEPIIRADFKAAETFAYRKRPSLDIPISVMTGTDEGIDYEKMMAWQQETTAAVEALSFRGNHFFIFDHAEAIVDLMVQKLHEATVTIS